MPKNVKSMTLHAFCLGYLRQYKINNSKMNTIMYKYNPSGVPYSKLTKYKNKLRDFCIECKNNAINPME